MANSKRQEEALRRKSVCRGKIPSMKVTCEDLNLLFQKYGKIVEIAKCTNFAYVEFSLDFQASHALEK